MSAAMYYEYTSEGGPVLTLWNEGGFTHLDLRSVSPGQSQAQSAGSSTGAWKGKPELFRRGSELIVRLQTEGGTKVLRIHGTQVQTSSDDFDASTAEALPLREAKDKPAPLMKPMEPMRPMEPMKPMEPMRPMEPMKPMRPFGQ